MTYKFVKDQTMHISLNPHGDFSLHKDQVYDLPEINPHVKTLVAMGYLVECEKEISKPKKPQKT